MIRFYARNMTYFVFLFSYSTTSEEIYVLLASGVLPGFDNIFLFTYSTVGMYPQNT